jgi:hypothetical protein
MSFKPSVSISSIEAAYLADEKELRDRRMLEMSSLMDEVWTEKALALVPAKKDDSLARTRRIGSSPLISGIPPAKSLLFDCDPRQQLIFDRVKKQR